MRLTKLCTAIALFVISGGVLTVQPLSAATVTLSPTDDAYVSGTTTDNYGSADALKCGAWQEMWTNATPGLKATIADMTMMKFNIADYKGKITAAKLTLNVTNPPTNSNTRAVHMAFLNVNNWQEGTVTGANCGMSWRATSGISIEQTSFTTNVAKGATATWTIEGADLMSLLAKADAAGDVSLAFYSVGQELTIASKEATTGAPTLELTYAETQLYAAYFTENSGEMPQVTVYDASGAVATAAALPAGSYTYTATSPGYEKYTGSFTVTSADVTQTFTMTPIADKPTFDQPALAAKYKEYILGYCAASVSTDNVEGFNDADYGKGYVYHMGADIYLATAQSHVNLVPKSNRGQSTDFTVSPAGITYNVDSKGAKTIAGTVSAGRWYRLDVSLPLSDVLNNAQSGNTFTFTLTDLSVGTQITADGISVRNAGTSGALRAFEVSTTFGDDDATCVRNVVSYFVPAAVQRVIGQSGYATFSAVSAVSVPAGATVYTLSAKDATTLTATRSAATAIPAATGVIVRAAAGTELTFQPCAAAAPLTSCLTAAPAGATSDGTYYALLKDEAAFASVAGGVALAANTAYYKTAGAAARIAIDFADATAIDALAAPQQQAQQAYNALGQRVNAAASGVVIVNGKVFINK